jgi:hypothetical protein
MVLGIVFDLIAIPWPYVVATYFRESGERWRGRPRATGTGSETPAGPERVAAG